MNHFGLLVAMLATAILTGGARTHNRGPASSRFLARTERFRGGRGLSALLRARRSHDRRAIPVHRGHDRPEGDRGRRRLHAARRREQRRYHPRHRWTPGYVSGAAVVPDPAGRRRNRPGAVLLGNSVLTHAGLSKSRGV